VREPFPALTWNQKVRFQCGPIGSISAYGSLSRPFWFGDRFVSGYQGRRPEPGRSEIPCLGQKCYLPGAGWRGYDPTNGIAVADRHVTQLPVPYLRNAALSQEKVKRYAIVNAIS